MKKNIVIAVAIHKGGSGKSTTTGNLAFALSDMGYKVLIVDTDGQMNLTRSFNLSDPASSIPTEERKSFFNAFTRDEDIRNHIVSSGYENLDFVKSDISLVMIETIMNNISLREFRARDVLEPLVSDHENGYDFIFLDLNPSLGAYNTSLLHASNEILIPVEPAMFGVEGLPMFFNYVRGIQKHNKKLKLQDVNIMGIFMNKINMGKNMSKDMTDIAKAGFQDYMLDVYIPIDTNIEKAQVDGVPLKVAFKQSRAVPHYDELAREVVRIVEERYK